MSSNPPFKPSELSVVLWGFKREFVVVGLFSMVANLLMLVPTLYMLQIYDRVLVSRSELTLLVISLMTLFLYGALALAEWSRSRVLVRAGVRLDQLLSTRVFTASFEANLSPAGADPARAFSDLNGVRQFLTGNGIFAFFDTPWTPIYIAVLFVLHPWLGVLALGFALIQAGLAWLGHYRSVAPADTAQNLQAEAGAFFQGKLRNAEVIESMGMLGGLHQRWATRHTQALAAQARVQALTHRLTGWSKFIRYSQQSLALGAGALLVIDGQISPGAMIAANVLTSRALMPLDQLVSSWRGFINARASFARLAQLLHTHSARVPALSNAAPSGLLELRNVMARAAGRAEPILKGISLLARPGTVTLVLGPTGSGKSTLARVMLGIWPEVSGQVLLDGQPITGWDRAALGPQLGYLPQDIELFDGSIAENIARLNEVDSERVIAAAKSAGLHPHILHLAKGYDTPIGEAGQLLSGGQRQRMGLARALYGEPALVVLDEPNANLDEAGEAALLKAVQELKARGATVVLISHRPGLLALADQVLHLRDGGLQAAPPRPVMAALPAMTHPAQPAPQPT